MKTSIRNKIVLSFTLLIALVFVFQLVFNLFFAREFYISYKSDAMNATFEAIKANYDGSVESIELAAESFEDLHNIDVFVWDSSYSILYTSHDRIMDYIGRPSPSNGGGGHVSGSIVGPQGIDAYSENPITGVRKDPMSLKSDVQTLGLNGKIIAGDEALYVNLTLPMASIEDSVAVFSNASLYISLAVLISGLFLCFAISKGITKPIKNIETAASKMADLDFSVHLDEGVSSNELASLSKSINSMSAQLESTIEELNIANQKLQADIDAQKKLERMRREFVGNVSHEMKTPLALLQLYADNLKNNVNNIDKEYYCDTIIEESEKLSDMVSSMLDMSSIESGLSKIELSKLCLSDLAEELLTKMSPLTENHNIEIDMEDEIFVDGNAKYLEQAMKNFVTNALEHTPQGELITVKLVTNENTVRFEVYNCGKPISELDMPFLWDSFYRVDKARVREDGNAGLGLHIVKTVILAHGGKCACQNMEQGVEFSFEIPLIEED